MRRLLCATILVLAFSVSANATVFVVTDYYQDGYQTVYGLYPHYSDWNSFLANKGDPQHIYQGIVAEMVSINTLEERAVLSQAIADAGLNYVDKWAVGGFQTAIPQDWHWHDGTALSAASALWWQNEPAHIDPEQDARAYLNSNHYLGAMDWLGDVRGGIYEYHVSVPIPEPSTLLLLGCASLFGAAFRKRLKK